MSESSNQSLVVSPAPKKDFSDFEKTSWDDLRRMSSELAPSDLLPAHLKGKPANVLIILQTAKELGIGAMQAINGVNVIQGKPSVSPELQLALVRGRHPEAFIKIDADHKAKSVTVTVAPSRDRMDESFTTTWDMARAKEMGLASKDNYAKQPLVMLKWRALGEAIRTVWPHVSRGIYNTVEAEDLFGRNTGSSFAGVEKAKDLNEKFGIKKSEPETIEIELAEPETEKLEVVR